MMEGKNDGCVRKKSGIRQQNINYVHITCMEANAAKPPVKNFGSLNLQNQVTIRNAIDFFQLFIIFLHFYTFYHPRTNVTSLFINKRAFHQECQPRSITNEDVTIRQLFDLRSVLMIES